MSFILPILALQVAIVEPVPPGLPPGGEPRPAPEEIAADAPVLPQAVRQMLGDAIRSDNEAEINTVAKYARAAAPNAVAEIDGLVRAWREQRTAAQQQRLAEAGLLDLWNGEVELGATRTTGIANTLGLSSSMLLTRQGEDWRHQVRGRIDYQEADGEAVRDAFLLAYEPRVQLRAAMFAYGLVQYDSDSFLGFDRRLSTSGGIGYRVSGPGRLTVDLDAGPTYRLTLFTDGREDSSFGGRGSLNLRWDVADGFRLTNNGALVVDSTNSTFTNTAALDARLIGSLSARLSYNLQYESMPPVGRATTGTISRATLVYDF